MSDDQAGRLVPPPLPQRPRVPTSASSLTEVRPPLPPRPSSSTISINVDEGSISESDSESGSESNADIPAPSVGAAVSTESLVSPKDEEELSEVQLRELYDDEEIERFLHLFSTYVREVRATDSPVPPTATQPASVSAPALAEPSSSTSTTWGTSTQTSSYPWDASRPISEVVAHDFLVPLLPAPRQPLPDFSLNKLKQTAQRLYVASEPLYSRAGLPLLKLATWKDPKRSFAYCALYWVLWYHGLLLSALCLRLLYSLIHWKLHPYPSLQELREHRNRIETSQAFSTILSTRLAAAPALGIRDMWDLFGDYRHVRKLKKKAKQDSVSKSELGSESRLSLDDGERVRSVSFSTPDLTEDHSRAARDAQEEADLKRLGLFLLNEVADLLERIKNIFLWRQPIASAYYGVVLLGYFVLGLLPARYIVRVVGLTAGFVFWHVTPIIAAIPASERNRIPSPLWIVPTDTEYAMELISQRVARGLPVRPKKRRPRRRSSDSSSVFSLEERGQGESTSIDWNKWGDRLTDTKEKASEIRNIFRDGQWKQSGSWKALNPLAPKVVAPQNGSEPRIETQTFPAQLKKNPGLITLTQTTLFFTPLLSSNATVTIPLADITGVKKTSLTKGVDVHYTVAHGDGRKEDKDANFMFVGSRSDLFARLVSLGGKRFAKV